MIRPICKAVLLATIAGSCGEERADCTPAAPCTTLPADLAVTSVSVISAGVTHPVSGLPVVDSLRVRYVVRNQGDSIAQPVQARVGGNIFDEVIDTLPVVPPRDSIVRTVTVRHTALFYTSSDNRDRTTVNVWLDADAADPQHNNFAQGTPVHLALPVLEVYMQTLNEPRVRVNDQLRLTITVTNRSPIIAARNIQLRHCLWDYDRACWADNWTAFGNIPLPDIAPGETRTISYTTAIPPTAMEERFRYYALTGCVTSSADSAAYLARVNNGTWVCGNAGLIEVWPDYEACSPPKLGAEPTTLSAPNCGKYPIPDEPGNWEFIARKQYYVFALDAEAGRTYQLNGLQDFGVYDNTGVFAGDLAAARDQVAFAHAGRYYIIIRRHTGVFTVSATALP